MWDVECTDSSSRVPAAGGIIVDFDPLPQPPSRAPPAAAGAGGLHVSFNSSASARTARSPPLIHELHPEARPIHPALLLGSH